jgi:hypothetical protein
MAFPISDDKAPVKLGLARPFDHRIDTGDAAGGW